MNNNNNNSSWKSSNEINKDMHRHVSSITSSSSESNMMMEYSVVLPSQHQQHQQQQQQQVMNDVRMSEVVAVASDTTHSSSQQQVTATTPTTTAFVQTQENVPPIPSQMTNVVVDDDDDTRRVDLISVLSSFQRENLNSSQLPVHQSENNENVTMICQRQTPSSSTSLPPTTTTTTTAITNNCVTSHLRYYDEGMYFYTYDLQEQIASATSSISDYNNIRSGFNDDMIVFNYNRGQSLIQSNDFMGAIQCFETALRAIHLPALPPLTASLIEHCIYHNIGYCYFCHSNATIPAACTYYQFAWDIAIKNQLPKINVDASYNALIVLKLFYNRNEATRFDQPRRSSNNNDNNYVNELDPIVIQKSIQILYDIYESYKSLFGMYSRQATSILYNIGRAHALRKDYSIALNTLEQCLQVRRQIGESTRPHPISEDDNVDIAVCICCIGQMHHNLGNYDIALQMYQQYIQTCCHLLHLYNNSNYQHLDITGIVLCMADIYMMKGNVQAAIDQCQYLISRYPNLVNISLVFEKLGDIYCNAVKDFGSALRCYMMCCSNEDKIFFQKPPVDAAHYEIHTHSEATIHLVMENAPLLLKIAYVQRQLKLYCAAIQIYHVMLDIYVQRYGFICLKNAKILSLIGKTLYEDKQYDLSIKFLYYELKIQMHHQCYCDSVTSAQTLNLMGLAQFHQHQYSAAVWCFQQSLRMISKLLGTDHYDNAILWYNMASVLDKYGSDDMAIQFYKESIRIELLHQSKITDIDESDTNKQDSIRRSYNNGRAKALKKLGSLYQKRGELNEALGCFKCALGIDIKACVSSIMEQRKSDHNDILDVAKLANTIGNINLQLGNISEMMVFLSSAARLLRHYIVVTGSAASNGDGETNNSNENISLVINGYIYYFFSRMFPPAASAA